MTDRELLERAARAIGATEYGGLDDCRPAGIVLLNGVPTNYEGNGEFGFAWNPLTDDGDAFRLAVKLRILVTFPDDCVLAVSRDSILGPIKQDLDGLDVCAAARRAIMRAAAAMAPEVAA